MGIFDKFRPSPLPPLEGIPLTGKEDKPHLGVEETPTIIPKYAYDNLWAQGIIDEAYADYQSGIVDTSALGLSSFDFNDRSVIDAINHPYKYNDIHNTPYMMFSMEEGKYYLKSGEDLFTSEDGINWSPMSDIGDALIRTQIGDPDATGMLEGKEFMVKEDAVFVRDWKGMWQVIDRDSDYYSSVMKELGREVFDIGEFPEP